MTENRSTPDSTPAITPDASSDLDATRPEQSAVAAPKRSRTRTLLVAGGAVLTAAVLAAGGIAVGAAIADEADDDDDRSSETASGQSADIGSDSAAELSEIIAAASDSAEGDAVSIEARRDGSWDVQFEASTGDETEVHVMANGTAEVVSAEAADAGDSVPRAVLDADTVDALVASALAEVDGKITELEIDEDTASPFDISVVQSNGRIIRLDLDADMKVLSIDGN